MPVIRGHHSFDDHFTQIPNDWLRDNRLSFKARGLLGLILSHSRGWSLSINSLAQESKEGRDAIRSAIAELEQYGYLSREQENSGRYGEMVWTTHDPTENPMTENPTTENPTTKNNIIKNNNLKNREREQFDEFWAIYPKKVDKAQALRQFKRALNRVAFEDILAGVIRFAGDPNLPEEKQYIKNPGTWLNADSWENGPLPERKKPRTNNDDTIRKWLNESE